MHQPKRLYKETTSNKEYKLTRRRTIGVKCTYCHPHRGCNADNRHTRSWKCYRKNQYRKRHERDKRKKLSRNGRRWIYW